VPLAPSRLLTAAVLAGVACTPASGAIVQAPAALEVPPIGRAPSAPAADLTACALPWTIEDVAGGPGRVVVVCGNDVRRQAVEPGVMTQAIDSALEPARQRVCGCAARMPPPAYVDLVVTSSPDEGRARVEASEPDEELDPALAPAFVACVGSLTTTFARVHADTCGTDDATFVYPLHVELGRPGAAHDGGAEP
jgi:hypothetical protein